MTFLLMFCEVLGVEAAESASNHASSYSIQTSLMFNYDNIDMSGSNVLLDFAQDVEYAENDTKSGYYSKFYRMNLNSQHFLLTDPQYYAYRIDVSPKPGSIQSDSNRVVWSRLTLGTLDESYAGKAILGNSSGSSGTSTFWYKNDYSAVNLYLGVLDFCNSYAYAGILDGADHDFSAQYTIYITPYYRDQFDQDSLDRQDYANEIAQDQLDTQQQQLEQDKQQTETQKGILASIKAFFASFFDNLINSIIHVIVPTTEEMKDLFDRLNQFFSDTFGFLYYPFEFIIKAVNIFLTSTSDTSLTFPGFSINGIEVWSDQSFDLTEFPVVVEIFGYVQIGTGALLAMAFVNYLRDFFDKRFGGGG